MEEQYSNFMTNMRGADSRFVGEREILRVVSEISNNSNFDVMNAARSEILKWARKRAGSILPAEAWNGMHFELPVAGRATMASCVENGDGVIWSLRADDPDKNVAGRIWSSEISLGRASQSGSVTLGLRLLVNSSERQLVIEPAVPGPVLQIADVCGLVDGPVPIRTAAHHVSEIDHVEMLFDWLNSPKRKLPIIVATGDEREGDPSRPMLDVDSLGKALCGLAHVVSLPAALSFHLSDTLGKELTVFHGGVRVYQPGFDLDTDPRGHRLILGYHVRRSPAETAAELQRSVARDSLRRSRLGHEIVSFAAVRSAAVQKQKVAQAATGVNDGERVITLEAQVAALNSQIDDLQGQVDQALQLSEEESDRADIAETQLYSSAARIAILEASLSEVGKEVAEAPIPSKWEEFVDWCDVTFTGRLTLASAARHGAKKSEFQDIDVAGRAIRWLAYDARTRFLEGGGELSNIPVFDGITNAPCGADEYTFDFQGRRISANWHLKNGGNTRQPERCLRIYYAFDDRTGQIIVSDMPSHRRTGAS
ncbi:MULTISPECIES: hypothetical protein [Sphingobium]|nr:MULTISPECIES: hypothetical protein [Sphingobium]